MSGLKEDLEIVLLAHRDEFTSKTTDIILADFIVACLAAYEKNVQDTREMSDATSFLASALDAFQAASLARWRWCHVAVSLGVGKVK